ncbi:TonB-dependent receptor [Longitalea luteola]|uniref:TonB-dependent receptor n=1 Tax=Longitalea luteola TaxID=2812563 RepID=UPI001A9618C5|nr:TonB-dependent receptor [Longitalea luteola]
MKLAIIFLTACFLQASAAGYAQKITLSKKNATLDQIFWEISRQSKYEFVYDAGMLREAKTVDIQVVNAPLDKVLNECFAGQPLTYTVLQNMIIVKRKPVQTTVAPPPPPITGKVTNEKGEPLAGATVRVKGTDKMIVADVNGQFSFADLPENTVLIISYTGYIQNEIAVKGQNSLHVVLKETAADLNSVVVVGYGTQKKVNLTGSVATIKNEDLKVRPVGQTSAALQGLAPGVTVTQRSGQPGGDAGNIRIRGIGTLGDSDPMVLIDGIEGTMNNVDPNTIESISILKDAASSAIYGSRAANGVILITTKRAKGNQLSVNYDAYGGWQRPTNLPKMVNAIDHMLLTNEAYVNVGRAPLYSDDLIDKYRTEGPANRDLYPETDWQKEVLTGSGFQQNHFVSVNGGTDKIKSFASFGYFNQKGVIETTDFTRYMFRNNTDFKFSDKLGARFDLQFINAVQMEPGRGAENVFHWMNRIPANQAGYNTDGSWGEGWNGDNPIAFSRVGGTAKNSQRSGTLNFSLNYQPFKWLRSELTVAPVIGETITKTFNRVVQTYKPDGTVSNFLSPARSALTETSNKSLRNNVRATITFEKDLQLHELKLLAGFSREDFRNDYISAYRDGFILPDYPVLAAGDAVNQKSNGNSAEWALQSLFTRLNYNYKEKYLFEANLRYDGSSRFAPGNKYGLFPSMSAGWRISQENFMEPLAHIITDMKIRASWGQLGNQNIGNYPFASQIEFGASTLGKQIVNTAALNTAANVDISWETTEMANIALDLALFSNLSITAEYYDKKSRDILYVLDIPLIMGLSAPPQNVGVVSNKGWELGVNYNGAIRDFKYHVNVNVSDVRNKVMDLRGINRTGLTVSREGYPIASIYGLEAIGYFVDDKDVADHAQQFGIVKPGDLKYKDQNNDRIINDLDNVVIGSTIPRYTYGINLGASYKGFNLSAMIQGVGKADGYLYRQGIMPFYEGGTVQEQHKDHWTPDNPHAAFPRLAFSEVNNEKNSSFWMKNAAYMRLKNIQIGYTFPGAWSRKLGMRNLRLYVNGSNVFTLDKFWNGYDVESPVGIGNSYPQVKVFSFGLNANF